MATSERQAPHSENRRRMNDGVDEEPTVKNMYPKLDDYDSEPPLLLEVEDALNEAEASAVRELSKCVTKGKNAEIVVLCEPINESK